MMTLIKKTPEPTMSIFLGEDLVKCGCGCAPIILRSTITDQQKDVYKVVKGDQCVCGKSSFPPWAFLSYPWQERDPDSVNLFRSDGTNWYFSKEEAINEWERFWCSQDSLLRCLCANLYGTNHYFLGHTVFMCRWKQERTLGAYEPPLILGPIKNHDHILSVAQQKLADREPLPYHISFE